MAYAYHLDPKSNLAPQIKRQFAMLYESFAAPIVPLHASEAADQIDKLFATATTPNTPPTWWNSAVPYNDNSGGATGALAPIREPTSGDEHADAEVFGPGMCKPGAICDRVMTAGHTIIGDAVSASVAAVVVHIDELTVFYGLYGMTFTRLSADVRQVIKSCGWPSDTQRIGIVRPFGAGLDSDGRARGYVSGIVADKDYLFFLNPVPKSADYSAGLAFRIDGDSAREIGERNAVPLMRASLIASIQAAPKCQ